MAKVPPKTATGSANKWTSLQSLKIDVFPTHNDLKSGADKKQQEGTEFVSMFRNLPTEERIQLPLPKKHWSSRGKNEYWIRNSLLNHTKGEDNFPLKENLPSITQTFYSASLSPAEDKTFARCSLHVAKYRLLHNVSLPLASLKLPWKSVAVKPVLFGICSEWSRWRLAQRTLPEQVYWSRRLDGTSNNHNCYHHL